MRTLLLLFFLIAFTSIKAQIKNIFLDREFWKSKPSVEQVKEKIKEGHNPTEKDRFSFDAVSYAIIDDVPSETIKYLLTIEGNPVEKPTHGGVTYLLWSSYKGNLEIMNHLISLGANTNMVTSRGTNMLHMAAIGGVADKKVYDLILDQKIDVNWVNENGTNVVHILGGSKLEDISIFDYFFNKGIKIESLDKEGNNLFNYAARGGNMEVMKMCVQKQLDYSSLNDKGENALLFASTGMKRRNLKLDVFKYLEALGLEVDIVNWEGKTPLHMAVRRGDPELIDFFIEKGVNINQVDENGNTALINAVGSKIENFQKVAKLSKHVNHQNNEGFTALTLAIKRGSKDTFDYLIKNGADIHIQDKEGNNLMFYAFESYYPRNEETYAYFIDTLNTSGVKAANRYTNGNTLAHIAIEKESDFLLNKSLALGVDINLKNGLNLSPLHLAAMKSKDKNLLSILLKNGADKSSKTEYNESAYDLAQENEILATNNVRLGFLKTN
ncbi:MAG: ankyrin repeat domain-containing protein [Flavobacteriaceae bacterium]|nr:ankyrin repeat domain-containing protein [Flavobacteriaceae bacterium]